MRVCISGANFAMKLSSSASAVTHGTLSGSPGAVSPWRGRPAGPLHVGHVLGTLENRALIRRARTAPSGGSRSTRPGAHRLPLTRERCEVADRPEVPQLVRVDD